MKKRSKAILLLCLIVSGAVGQHTGEMIRARVRVKTKIRITQARNGTIGDINDILAWDE